MAGQVDVYPWRDALLQIAATSIIQQGFAKMAIFLLTVAHLVLG